MNLLNILGLDEIRAGNRSHIETVSRLLSSPVYLGMNTALCRILGRYKLYVDTRDEGFGSHLLLDGFWEIWLTMFIARMIKPGMNVIDVGANFGYYSVLTAELVGPTGKVIAIEPNHDTTAFLKRTIRLNGYDDRTVVIESAVGNNPDNAALLFTPHAEPKNATIVATAEQVDQTLGSLTNVSSCTIDSLLPQIGRVDFIKIDAEGAEHDIFLGMRQTIEIHDPDIVLEFNAARYADPGAFIDELRLFWPNLRHIDFHGECLAISKDEIMQNRFGKDWLLFLSSKSKI